MFNVASEREEALKPRRNIGLHVERRHSRVEGREHDYGYVQARKHIDGHSCKYGDPENRDYQRANDYRMRIAKRNPGIF